MTLPTKPRLTQACLATLRSLTYSVRPRVALPAQSRATILHHKLADVVLRPSPYAKDRGKLIEHLTINDAGTARLQGELPLASAQPLARAQTHG